MENIIWGQARRLSYAFADSTLRFHCPRLGPINFIGKPRGHWLTPAVSQSKNNAAVAGSLLFTVFLWGGNNAGTKWLVMVWPPIWTGGIRFLLAGGLLLAVLRWTSWLGERHVLVPG